MTTRRYIGLSSGSSLSGVDAALVRIDGAGPDLVPRLEHCVHDSYSRDVRELLLRAQAAPGPRHLGLVHRVLGETFANAARKVVEQAKQTWQQMLAVGMSGYTAWHDADGRFASTLTLGMPAALAERTGLTVVSDFRSRDLLVGGQGYPLTSLVDAILFRADGERRALLHLGGVASVVCLPSAPSPIPLSPALAGRASDGQQPSLARPANAADRGRGEGLPGLRDGLAFQAAPCGLLLDGLMRLLTGGREAFDPGGKYAVQGRCLEPLVERWLAHPLFKRKPPRSVPCHEFGPEFLAQAVELAKQPGRQPARSALLGEPLRRPRHRPGHPAAACPSGAGAGQRRRDAERSALAAARNAAGAGANRAHRPPRHPRGGRKAMAFAALAALAMDGVPANVPASTGAAGPRLLGSFTPGAAANWARCLAWMAGQTAHLRLAA